MAKGDHKRSENRQDEQMKQGQGYLTGVQQNMANQYGGLNNLYMGGMQPQVGGTFGYGSTVPHFSWTGNPYYSGNGTGTATPIGGNLYGGSGGNTFNESTFRQLMGDSAATPQNLLAREADLNRMGIEVMRNASGVAGKIKLPNGNIIDVVPGAMAGGGGSWQWLDNWANGGGGLGAGMGGGIIPGTLGDYSALMGRYGGLYDDLRGQFGGLIGSASNMANTGGLSDADKGNIRARAISPIRSIYSSGERELERQRSLQGGYSPGFTSALTRMNRDRGQQISDATTNAEGMIAEMVQRGKLGGLSAWGSGLGSMASGLLGALGGQAGLYGATPGLANMFGNQMLQSMGQQLQGAGLQNQLSLGLMGNQNNISQIPGNYQSALGNISGTLGVGGQIGGMIYPWLGGGPAPLPNYGPGRIGGAGIYSAPGNVTGNMPQL